MRPSGEPGKGEALCTGMIGCSPTQRESNPNASACRATTATSTGCCVGNIKIPYFMTASFHLYGSQTPSSIPDCTLFDPKIAHLEERQRFHPWQGRRLTALGGVARS